MNRKARKVIGWSIMLSPMAAILVFMAASMGLYKFIITAVFFAAVLGLVTIGECIAGKD